MCRAYRLHVTTLGDPPCIGSRIGVGHEAQVVVVVVTGLGHGSVCAFDLVGL
jgi:hypothetical protein